MKKIRRYLHDNRAVAALEYALLVALVSVIVAAGVKTLSTDIVEGIKKVGLKVKTIAPETPVASNSDG